jgi:hypothetical protein
MQADFISFGFTSLFLLFREVDKQFSGSQAGIWKDASLGAN